jgi:hypothetical protein
MKPLIFNRYDFPQVLAEQPISVSLTVDDVLHTEDTSALKVFLQIEPPEVFDITDKLIENHKFYDLILSWNTKILRECPNAKLFPFFCCSWLPWNSEGHNPNHARPQNGVPYTECDISKKQFKASYLTSWKAWTPGHILRQQIYEELPNIVGSLPIIKHKSPPWLPDKRNMLYDYQFVISPLNASHDNWFDDKLGDPLISKTIPLIWGCPNLGNFFNMDGIIKFDTIPEMLERLSELTPDYYEKHLDAVMDNYHRAMVYSPVWSRVDKEITEGIARKGIRNEDSVNPGRPDTVREGNRRPFLRKTN